MKRDPHYSFSINCDFFERLSHISPYNQAKVLYRLVYCALYGGSVDDWEFNHDMLWFNKYIDHNYQHWLKVKEARMKIVENLPNRFDPDISMQATAQAHMQVEAQEQKDNGTSQQDPQEQDATHTHEMQQESNDDNPQPLDNHADILIPHPGDVASQYTTPTIKVSDHGARPLSLHSIFLPNISSDVFTKLKPTASREGLTISGCLHAPPNSRLQPCSHIPQRPANPYPCPPTSASRFINAGVSSFFNSSIRGPTSSSDNPRPTVTTYIVSSIVPSLMRRSSL